MTYATDDRIDTYISHLPEWQQSICQKVRDLVHDADPAVIETSKRTDRPYFVLDGNICALQAAKDHVNVFLYDGGMVPDPAGIITGGHTNKTARTIAIYKGERINTRALTQAQDEIAAEGGQIAAIMPDQQHFTAELKAEHDAPFPILTDIDNGYAMSLNLAFWVGAEMQELMTCSGWDVSRSQGSDTWLLPIPATFVVGTDGEVKARFVDPDYRKRVSVEDLIAALKDAH